MTNELKVGMFVGALVATLIAGIFFVAGAPPIRIMARDSANLAGIICGAMAGVLWLTYAATLLARNPIFPAALLLSIAAGLLFICGFSQVGLMPSNYANFSGIVCGALATIFWVLFGMTYTEPETESE